MVSRFGVLQARLLPQGWRDVVRQVLLFALAYTAYGLVRGLVAGSAASAFAHARDVIGIERKLHIFIEPSIQAWASGSHLLIDASSWLYLNAQTTVTVGALAYLYLCHNRSFYFVRNMLMIAMAIALVGYAVFPTAPPRFMPEWGFVDSVADYTGMRLESVHGGGGLTSALTNLYAAVPSMHVAFSIIMGWPLARLVRPRPLRVLWAVYPLLVTFVIIATANHFLLDSILGAVTAGVAAYGARWLARARPAVWRFSPVDVGAPAPVQGGG